MTHRFRRTRGKGGTCVFAWFRKQMKKREHGFTLIELVVVLAILAILIGLAVPRYLGARKKAYKAEADNVLQESKTLQWAYYQQYNAFDTTGNSIGLAIPNGMHWTTPTFSLTGTAIDGLMTGNGGSTAPIGTTDSLWITLGTDGSSSSGGSF